MNKNLILLAIGGIGAYLLISRKKASATNVEPIKSSDSTPKEPSSQADCGEGMRFIPAQKAEESTLRKKDGTTGGNERGKACNVCSYKARKTITSW